MRLIDQILNYAGKDEQGGTISDLRELILQSKPQCFEMDKDVERACMQVCASKPSSVVSALSYARLPYPAVWIERPILSKVDPNDIAETLDGQNFQISVPRPTQRGGVLLLDAFNHESVPLSSAIATWAWSFPGNVVGVAPMSVFFDWYQPLKAAQHLGVATTRELNRLFHRYLSDKQEIKAAEELGTHHLFMPCPLAAKLWEAFDFPVKENQDTDRKAHYQVDWSRFTDTQKKLHDSILDDLAGEDSLVTGFLLMLNSPNSLVKEREDLRQLNKARQKKHKPPLQSGFIKTQLRIPRSMRYLSGNSEVERAQARLHMVRGHFKVRKTGVFWWTPHPRGKGHPEVKRESYSVHTASQ